MTITIVPICHDCNEELSNWDRFLNKKYPNTLGYTLCSQCEKRREEGRTVNSLLKVTATRLGTASTAPVSVQTRS